MNSPSPSIAKGDSDSHRAESSEAIIILDRLRSAHNVGNMLRLADAINARCVYTCGYTCTPPHEKLKKTAMGTDEFVPCRHFPDSKSAVESALSDGYEIVAVDTIEGAENCLQSDFQSKTAFVFGNEALGINEETLPLCQRFVSLPARGRKNSINVSNCAAVVLFHYIEQQSNS